jgi:alginate O-acetyltransferase complex protein AlgI
MRHFPFGKGWGKRQFRSVLLAETLSGNDPLEWAARQVICFCMLFNSYVFIFCYLPATLIGFYGLSTRYGAATAKAWLILASLVYYGWWNPAYLGLLIPSMVFNFWCGKLLRTTRDRLRLNGILLVLGVAANLSLLGYFKYAGFLVSNVNGWLGTSWTWERVIIPLGISFFTFQQTAYLIDASRGVVGEGEPGDYFLFVVFFPYLTAGPITHHAEMLPQFARSATYQFRWENLALGWTLFAMGLFKKAMIADALSPQVGRVFEAAASGTLGHVSDAWAGALAYTLQIYFDFSGYSDMALGLARMFGVILPLNFHSPYQAANIIDFWRRWHITFSRWILNYVFLPLQMRWRHGRVVGTSAALVITFLFSGLWHGAGWTFITWGFLHGSYLLTNHFFQTVTQSIRASWRPPVVLSRVMSRGLTFLAIMVGWVVFRAASLKEAGVVLGTMAGWGTPDLGQPGLLKPRLWLWLVALLVFVWWAPHSAEVLQEEKPALITYKKGLSPVSEWLRWRLTWPWVWFTAGLLAVSILCLSQASEFLYYSF